MHDPRLTWNTLDIVEPRGGEAVQSKSGHAFIKQRMREVDAVYGGEMSAHHYFRDFSYCDSGMIPWLLSRQIMCRAASRAVEARRRAHARVPRERRDQPQGQGRAGRHRARAKRATRRAQSPSIDTDGLSVEFADWRFNLRSSNTEPLLRLNVESRGDEALMREKTAELLALLGGEPG